MATVDKTRARLSTEVSGKLDAEETIVFLSGFPDDHRSWDSVLPMLSSQFRTVTLTMPGYSDALDEPKVPRFGFGFDDIVTLLDNAICELGTAPVTLVGHDWGAFITLMYCTRHPERVKKYVALDVGVLDAPSFFTFAVIIAYQVMFATAFVLSALGLGWLGTLVIALYPWHAIGPTPHESKVPPAVASWRTKPEPKLCYPYYQLLRLVATNSMPKLKVPPPPTLYIFGKRKRAQFHDDGWLAALDKRTDGSRWLSLDCGHFIASQKPDETAAAIEDFIGQ